MSLKITNIFDLCEGKSAQEIYNEIDLLINLAYQAGKLEVYENIRDVGQVVSGQKS